VKERTDVTTLLAGVQAQEASRGVRPCLVAQSAEGRRVRNAGQDATTGSTSIDQRSNKPVELDARTERQGRPADGRRSPAVAQTRYLGCRLSSPADSWAVLGVGDLAVDII